MDPISPTMHASRVVSAIASRTAHVDLSKRLAEQRLQAIAAAVSAHEHAHVAALGKGVIVYDTVIGPDGVPYAVGGSVAVDLSPVPGDPAETIRKARKAMQAAAAVGEPSAADVRVAAEAYQLEMEAQKELEREQAAGGIHEWYA